MSKLSQIAKQDPYKLTISYSGSEHVLNLTEELDFDEVSLPQELETHCSKISIIYLVYERMRTALEDETRNLAVLKAKKWLAYKDEDTGTKPRSDSKVDMLVMVDPEVIESENELSSLKSYVKLLQAVVSMFETREKLMQTYSSNIRKVIL